MIENELGELAKVGTICVHTLCGDSELFNEIKSQINKLRFEYEISKRLKANSRRKVAKPKQHRVILTSLFDGV